MADGKLIGPGGADGCSVGDVRVKSRIQDALLNRALPVAGFLAQIVIPRLPRFAVIALANLVGTVIYLLMRGRRLRIAQANLEVAFGDTLSATAKRRVIWDSACNLVLVVLDLFWFSRNRERRLEKYVTFDPSVDAASSTLPAIVVTAHLGNWEMLSQALAMRGYHAVIPYAPLHNAAADRLLRHLRRDIEQELVPRSMAGRTLMRALRDGRSIGLLLDQNAARGHEGGFVDLFSLPVPAPSAVSRLARRSRAPIVPLFCVPTARGGYRVYSRPPRFAHDLCDSEDTTADTQIAQWIMNQIEEEIRRYPGLWFWTFRRWRYIPFGRASFGKYPYYADTVVVPPDCIRNRSQAKTSELQHAHADALPWHPAAVPAST